MTSVTVLPCGDVPVAEQIWTIVVGGGSGRRFGSAKQFELLGDRRVIDHAATSPRRGVRWCGRRVIRPRHAEREGAVAGGETRSDSVRAGLDAVPADATIICVHDAARPFASAELYERVIAAVRDGAPAAIPGIAVSDTIKVVADGVVAATLDRDSLVAVQTPQAFRADVLRAAHADRGGSTDDAALVEALGCPWSSSPARRRIARSPIPDDLEWARGPAGRSDDGSSGLPGRSGIRRPPVQRRPVTGDGARRLPLRRRARAGGAQRRRRRRARVRRRPARCGRARRHRAALPRHRPEWAGADSMALLRHVVGDARRRRLARVEHRLRRRVRGAEAVAAP